MLSFSLDAAGMNRMSATSSGIVSSVSLVGCGVVIAVAVVMGVFFTVMVGFGVFVAVTVPTGLLVAVLF